MGETGATAVFAAVAGAIFLVRLLAGLATAIVLVLVFPGFTHEIVSETYQSFWRSEGIGIETLLVVPAAVVCFAATIIGAFAALILGILFVFMLIIASIYSGILFGSFIAKLVRKEYVISWLWALLGTLGITLISLVPFVGWLVGFMFFLAALGTIGLGVYKRALKGM
ncbi:MAG: hypothetical protein AAB923_00575 [Patescibacteria group bacterium]